MTKMLDALLSAINAPKRAVDVAANFYSGLDQQALSPTLEPYTTGDLVKEAISPSDDPKSHRLAGTVAGMATDVFTNPLTYVPLRFLPRTMEDLGPVGSGINQARALQKIPISWEKKMLSPSTWEPKPWIPTRK